MSTNLETPTAPPRAPEYADLADARAALTADHYIAAGIFLPFRILPASELSAEERSLLAAGTLNAAAKPEPGLSTRDAEAALTKLLREVAENILIGNTMDSAKTWPEWQELRALYFLYCGGFEDALYERTAILAAAVRADKSAWVGEVVLHAWYEYTDPELVKRVEEQVALLRSRDGR